MCLSKPSSPPFFIVGCGRSGTSLLRSIIDAHPDVAVPTESLFLIDYLKAQRRFELDTLKSMVLKEPELKEWKFDFSPNDLQSCSSIPDVIRELHMLYALSRGKASWGQKTPRFVRHLELLSINFPDARYVHIVRDPRAVVSSLIDSNVHRSDAIHGVRRWIRDVQAGLAFQSDHPEEILLVSYEQLVQEPEHITRQITDHLGLDFVPEMLEQREGQEIYGEFYENIHANLGREMLTQNVEKWRRRLNERQISVIEWHAHELMEALGYPVEGEIEAPKFSERIRFQSKRVLNLFPQSLRYLRYRRAYLFFMIYRKARLGFLKEFLWQIHY